MNKTELLQQLQQYEWTSHNIQLTDTITTLADQVLLADDNRMQTIKQNVYLFCKKPTEAKQRSLDLGCLEGGLTIEMAKLGFDSLGVEGQDSNYQKCDSLQQYFDWDNLKFLLMDVKQLNPQQHGLFDVILCCGLLYHLDHPVSFLAQMATLLETQGFTFVDTHIAPASDAALADCVFQADLSELTEISYQDQTYRGRWYHEYDQESDKNAWTSVSNRRSFWLLEDDLIRALNHAGFSQIYKPYGMFEVEQEFELRKQYSRSYYVAVKPDYF